MNKFRILVCIFSIMLLISIIPAICESTKHTISYRNKSPKYNSLYLSDSNTNISSFQNGYPSASVNSSDAYNIISQVNAERSKYGLSPVKVSSKLMQAAYIRAQELPSLFSHTRPNGTSWKTVSAYAKAENIARGYTTADKAVAAWLTSEGHRRNIMNSKYTSIGVCAYEYNGIMYWVQLFGTE